MTSGLATGGVLATPLVKVRPAPVQRIDASRKTLRVLLRHRVPSCLRLTSNGPDNHRGNVTNVAQSGRWAQGQCASPRLIRTCRYWMPPARTDQPVGVWNGFRQASEFRPEIDCSARRSNVGDLLAVDRFRYSGAYRDPVRSMSYRSISYDGGFENASGSIISQKFISTLHGRSNALTHARLDEPGEASRPPLYPSRAAREISRRRNSRLLAACVIDAPRGDATAAMSDLHVSPDINRVVNGTPRCSAYCRMTRVRGLITIGRRSRCSNPLGGKSCWSGRVSGGRSAGYCSPLSTTWR